MTPITGNIGFLAVGNTAQLSNATPAGAWASSDTSIATVSGGGLLTGVSNGNVTITYTVGVDVASLPVNILALAYTNGLDISRILPVLIGRKGWKQPTQSSFPFTLNSINKSCSSGRYYQRDNTANSPEKLWNAQEDSAITEAEFNAYLTDAQVGVCMDALNSVFRRPSLIEQSKIIFEKSFRTSYKPITNGGKFCGWQLNIADGPYTSKIESISITATKACTVTVYLYNDLRQLPLWRRDIVVTVPNDQTIMNIDDLYLTRLDDQHKGGVFFFGYYQQQLEDQGAKGVDVYLNWWEDPNMFAYQAFEASSSYTDKTFIRDNYFSNYRTYGLGVEISTFWNYTNIVCRQAHEFDNLMGLMMTQKSIEDIVNSPRSTSDQSINANQLQDMYDVLNGTRIVRGETVAVNYKTGLKNLIELEVMRVQDTFFPKPELMHSIPPVNSNNIQLPTWGHMI